MIQEYQLRVLPEVAANEQQLKEYLVQEKGLNVRNINATRILKRSIDARQRTIFVNLNVRVYLNEMPKDDEYQPTVYKNVEGKPQVVVVGAGPGGLFAALRLIELGLRPIIVERGKNVRDRKKDLAQISREHTVNPESNYSFGEGGAGAYSDGKLYTRSKKRGNVDKILNVFCQHGASTAILVDAHPHIGTDKLPRVIENMRNTILECGGEVHFETRMEALIIEEDEIKGIETHTGQTILGPVILATGHSARDVYRWLADNNVEIEAKGIAVGVRLEHPSELIDQIQYHNRNGRGKYLPAAEYSFVTQVDGRGVYSFCMCPGGFVVPAASGPQQIVVNGMSPSNRGSHWSNSGMVVELRPEDLENEKLVMQNNCGADSSSPILHPSLSMMYFQETLESACWQQGNMRQTAPAQRMLDFTRKKPSPKFICPGINIFSASLLDALISDRKTQQRFPAIRAVQSWIPYKRGRHDWRRNTHICSCTDHKRQGYIAARQNKGTVSLWRRSRICRWNRIGRHRRRTMRRSSSQLFQVIELDKNYSSESYFSQKDTSINN